MAYYYQDKRLKMPLAQSGDEFVRYNYKNVNILGTGSFGAVYRAFDTIREYYVTVKKLRVALGNNGVNATTLKEISTIKQLNRFNHPNIVELLDVCQFRERNNKLLILLAFEYMEQDLCSLIEELPEEGMLPSQVQFYTFGILSAIEFLHGNRVINHDLKPQNVFFSKRGILKISDFGLAETKSLEKKINPAEATLWYRAPELLIGNGFNGAVDIWSAACIIFEMVNRKPLFEGTSEKDQLDCIFALTGRPAQEKWPPGDFLSWDCFPAHVPKRPRDFCAKLSEPLDDLLHQMLLFEYHLRPTASDCFRTKYFEERAQ